jgi:hypothetical protein
LFLLLGAISAISVQGVAFSKVYRLDSNAAAISFQAITEESSSPSSSPIHLSQVTSSDSSSLLFLSTLSSPHSILLQVYSSENTLVKPYTEVRSSTPLSSLFLSQGYYSTASNNYGLVGVTRDELLFGTKTDENLDQISWTREESLSSILDLDMVDYPSEVGPTWNPYLAIKSNPLSAFVSRIKYEIEAILTGESLYSSSEDRFGLRKVIVIATRVGKIIGMDGASGNILYSFFLPDFALFRKAESAYLFVQRVAKYTPLKPQAVLVYRSCKTGSTIVYAFNPVEGKPLEEPKVYPPVLQVQMVHHAGEETEFIKPILLLDEKKNVHVYPGGAEVDVNKVYFLVAEESGGEARLKGFDVRQKQQVLCYSSILLNV